MSWRERLAARRGDANEKRPDGELTKPTKPPFVGFDSTQDGPFPANSADDMRAGLLVVCDAHQERERMDRGLPPLAWGEPVPRTCTGCGPVLLWPECPPVVAACPWCFRRKVGKPVARPPQAPRDGGRPVRPRSMR